MSPDKGSSCFLNRVMILVSSQHHRTALIPERDAIYR
ncbi:hypothetical protein Nmel_000982 [Mimus melanotis]